MTINRITVKGYKALQNAQSIDIKNLTVIAGVNSSGKSSVVQPLLLLKQTLDASYDPGPLLLDGANVNITAIEQVLSRGQTRSSQVKSFTLGLGYEEGKVIELKFGKNPKGDLKVLEMSRTLPNIDRKLVLREGMSDNQIREAIPGAILENYTDIIRRLRDRTRQLAVVRDRSFLDIGVRFSDGPSSRTAVLTKLSSIVYDDFSTDSIEAEISRIIHLPALRGNPARTYRTVAVEGRYPGTFETYTAGIIAAWQNRHAKSKLATLKSDLEEIGLTWKVEAKQIDDTQVELLVGRLPRARQGGAHDVVNIADVGFGVSQTLPVIVALIAASPGQIVYLEQPEIHLHPRAQFVFGNLLARAVSRGVKVILETHSSLLIRSIQTKIAQGVLSPRDVSLNWFARNPTTGFTAVTAAELENDGSFGDWPEDFDEVYLEAESKYLDAATEYAAYDYE
ncbi:AAA family ATPase [Actinomadura montaniterrae]|uniref:AAA family ATPase n=1 Tax=Actinomadura montaniterrae TaxID=1803903 RepID=UPI001CEFA4D0|nr:AAA family ATPase [Actinomadura montaniterrae]